jgi:hypothetical protein
VSKKSIIQIIGNGITPAEPGTLNCELLEAANLKRNVSPYMLSHIEELKSIQEIADH